MTRLATDTPAAIADLLRNAAAWLELAARKLDEGDLEGAMQMAKLGEFGTEGVSTRIKEATR